MKQCIKCNKFKPVDAFNKRNIKKGYLQSTCRECSKMIFKTYYKENKNSLQKNKLDYYYSNKESRNAAHKNWLNQNKQNQSIYKKTYCQNHKEEIRRSTKQYYHRVLKFNTLFKIAQSARNRINTALKTNRRTESTLKLLGCSIVFLKKHLESQFKDGMSWDNHGEWHIDHIKPLASFDLANKQELKEACYYSNLQPLWARENLRKGNRVYV